MTTPEQFLIYQSEDGSTRMDVLLQAETIWLSQKQLTELFGKAKGMISEHIKHIFEDGELVAARADSRLPNMGLTNWQGAGAMSAQLAQNQAEQEFDRFKAVDDLRFESDFDQKVKQLAAKPLGQLS
jgi:hypothetical protein